MKTHRAKAQDTAPAPTPVKFGNELMNPKNTVLSVGFSRGVRVLFVMFALLVIALPAQADIFEESEESYYARQMKSCFYKKPRTSVWDLFAATRPVYLDDCCAQSVYAMEKAGAEWIHPDEACPEGSVKASLKCETSKHWCVSGAAAPVSDNAPPGSPVVDAAPETEE